MNRLSRFPFFSYVLLTLLAALGARATIDSTLQMQTGNPSSATADTSNHTHYLIQRAWFAMDFNDTTHEPNWVSWDLTSADIGSSGRSNFIVDTNLPAGFRQVLTTDYSGSGFDRGHMCPSADRTVTAADNQQVFVMSNMIPQAPDNNQGVWASFENYCRSQATAGNEVLIISGPSGFAGSTIASGVAIPGYTWKVAVIVPLGNGTAASRITATTRVIAIKIPNIAGVRNNPWQQYITSAGQIESDTGFSFFGALSTPIATALRAEVDGQTSAGLPTITTQPVGQTAALSGSATFSVTASDSGNPPLSYQWSKDDSLITDATDPTLTLTNVQATDAGNYAVTVTNTVGSVTSNGAALVVTGVPPSFVTQPVAQTISAGSSVTFTVVASGSPTITYKWQKAGSDLANGTTASGSIVSGATTDTLTISNAQSGDAASYNAIATNSVTSTSSNAVALAVNAAAPSITGQPSAQTVITGGTATFSVTATGTAPLSYQWRKAGTAITGNTSAATATLTLTNVQAADVANYDVVISNGVGTPATSNAVGLTIGTGFSSGNLVVVRVGSGTGSLLATGNPVFLDEYTTGGTLVRSVALPTATSGSNVPLILSGTATSEGLLTRSVDGKYLLLSGYNATAPTTSLTTTASATVNRTIAVINASANVDTTTSLSNYSTGSNPRSVASTDGTTLWMTGGAGGVLTASKGATTATAVSTTVTNLRTISIFGSQLYVSSASGTTRLATVGTGTPTTSSQTITNLPGFPTSTGSPYSFFFTHLNGSGTTVDTVYVADDGGTIQKYCLVNSSWTALGSVAAASVRGLTGKVNGTSVTLYGASGSSTATGGGNIYTVTDASGYNATMTGTPSTIASVSTTSNTTFRGIAFAPENPVPVAPAISSTTPVANATAVSPTAPITIVFNQAVTVSGSWFTISSAANGPVAATVNVSADAKTFTLTPPSKFADNDTVTVTLVATQITDQSTGTLHPTSNSSFSFTTATAVAPTITNTLADQSLAAGSTGTFTVTATGTAPFTYQWRKGGSALTGNTSASSATLTLTNLQATDAGSYDVVVSNGVSPSATSNAATLTVTPTAPTVTIPPVAQTISVGGTATFTVAATGTAPFTYQWRKDSVAITGNPSATTATLTLTNVQPGDAGSYDVVVTNGVGTPATSTAVTLTVSTSVLSTVAWDFTTADPTSGLPNDVTGGTVTQNNNNGTTAMLTTTSVSNGYTGATGTNNAGAAARIGALNTAASGSAYFEFTLTPATGKLLQATAIAFGVRSTGTGPQAYAIYSSVDSFTTPLASGSLSNDSVWRLITPSFATVTGAAGTAVTFRLFGYNGAGGAVAGTANWRIDDLSVALTTLSAPAVTTDPLAQTATVGDTVTFSVVASGSPAPTYQWRKGGSPLTDGGVVSGSKTATLTLTGITTADAANYDCVVTNSVNSATSNAATLTVNKATAAVVLGSLATTYDGTPKAATATTTPSGLTVTFTYNSSPTAPTNAGSYALVGTVNDANYVGTASGTLTIAKATAPVILGNLSPTYDGTPKTPSATTTPANLLVTYTYNSSPTAPTNAGSYAIAATVSDTNYTGSTSGTMVIGKATAPVVLGSLSPTYDGTPKAATATTTPANLAVSFTYNSSPTAPTIGVR